MTRITLPENMPCAERSRQVDEPLAGSATEAAVWLLLSYDRPWAAKATSAGENRLPAGVQSWLDNMLATLPGSRLQFIRRAGMGRGVHFFVSDVRPEQQRLFRFRLRHYRQLLELDLPAILAGDLAYVAHRVEEPLYLVCTNGRRDPCCAREGAAFYRALSAVAGDRAWQTTHLGGHRFAPTVLSLPTGALYGRLQPEDAGTFFRGQEQGKLSLSHLRGHTAYAPEAQAAEILLRRETGNMQQGAFRPGEITFLDAEQMQISFTEVATGEEHIVRLRRTLFAPSLYASCHKPQVKPVYQYQFLSAAKP